MKLLLLMVYAISAEALQTQGKRIAIVTQLSVYENFSEIWVFQTQ